MFCMSRITNLKLLPFKDLDVIGMDTRGRDRFSLSLGGQLTKAGRRKVSVGWLYSLERHLSHEVENRSIIYVSFLPESLFACRSADSRLEKGCQSSRSPGNHRM